MLPTPSFKAPCILPLVRGRPGRCQSRQSGAATSSRWRRLSPTWTPRLTRSHATQTSRPPSHGVSHRARRDHPRCAVEQLSAKWDRSKADGVGWGSVGCPDQDFFYAVRSQPPNPPPNAALAVLGSRVHSRVCPPPVPSRYYYFEEAPADTVARTQ